MRGGFCASSEEEKTLLNKLYNGNNASYLIFSIKGKRYALKSSLVQEIMYGVKVHKLPFVPDFVEGVLNCRGNPYTVVNTIKLEDENAENNADSEIEGKVFLLFKRDDDHFCIHISNIEVFFEPEPNDILEDSIKYKLKYIPLFDADKIESEMCIALGKDE